MFQHILVPLDGSDRAEQALPIAADIARASHSTLILVRVMCHQVVIYGWPSIAPIVLSQETIDEERALVKNYLMHLASSEMLRGISTQTVVGDGEPAEQIFFTAQTYQADLIVMGSHGRTGIWRWVLGSVAQKIARHSDIPVLILRERTDGYPFLRPGQAHPLRVMVPLDGSQLAEATIVPAAILSAALSAPLDGVLNMVHVVPLHVGYEYGSDDALTKARAAREAQARTYLRSLEQRISAEGSLPDNIHVTTSIFTGTDVAGILLAQTEAENVAPGSDGVDIIALATHGRNGLERWVMGSITERLLGETRVPLLIVRPHQKSKQNAFAVVKATNMSIIEQQEQPLVGLF